MKKYFFGSAPILGDVGLLILRVASGGLMAFNHGYPKFLAYSEKANSFPEVFGMSSATSLKMAIMGELIFPIFLVIGLMQRWILVPMIITMSVAVFDIHAGDPLKVKEHALLFLIPYIVLWFTGPGKYSLDRLIFRRA